MVFVRCSVLFVFDLTRVYVNLNIDYSESWVKSELKFTKQIIYWVLLRI